MLAKVKKAYGRIGILVHFAWDFMGSVENAGKEQFLIPKRVIIDSYSQFCTLVAEYQKAA